MFQNYKRIILLKYLKYITKNPYIINNQKYKNKELSLLQRVMFLREEQIKLKISKLLLNNFEIKRCLFKKFNVASANNKKGDQKQTNEAQISSINISPMLQQSYNATIVKQESKQSIKKVNSNKTLNKTLPISRKLSNNNNSKVKTQNKKVVSMV